MSKVSKRFSPTKYLRRMRILGISKKVTKYLFRFVIIFLFVIVFVTGYNLLVKPAETKNTGSTAIFVKVGETSETAGASETDKTKGKVFELTSDSVSAISNMVLMLVGVIALSQYSQSDRISKTEITQSIIEKDGELRQFRKTAIDQRRSIEKKLEKMGEGGDRNKEFFDLYDSIYYRMLKSVSYHYEYIGQMLFHDKIDFDVVFSTVTFPDALISDELEKKNVYAEYGEGKQFFTIAQTEPSLLSAGRDCRDDFWNGLCYLYFSYELRRKYAKRKTSRDDYKKAKKNWKIMYDIMLG